MRVPSSALLRGALTLVAVGTPLLMIAGYTWFDEAALRFRLDDPGRDYLLGALWAIAIMVAIQFLRAPASHRKALSVLWFARIGVTLGFGLVYEAFYGNDAIFYFNQALVTPSAAPLLSPEMAGTHHIIGLATLHTDLIPGSYHAIKVTWALVGMVAVYLFYRAAVIFLGREDIRFLYLIGLFPSILLWGSIFGKDPVTLLGIAAYALGVVGFWKRRRATYLVALIAGVALAAYIRVWLAPILLLPLGVFFVMERRHGAWRLLFALVTLPALLLSITAFSENFAIETSSDLVSTTDVLSEGWARGGSGQELAGGFGSLGDMVAFAPLGAVTALFRPLPGEVMNVFGILAGVENLVLIWLLVIALRRGSWRLLRHSLLMWVAVTIGVWAIAYGFVSYQNLGTAFRFKVQMMPFLLGLLLFMVSRARLPRIQVLESGPDHAEGYESPEFVREDPPLGGSPLGRV